MLQYVVKGGNCFVICAPYLNFCMGEKIRMFASNVTL